MVRIIYCIYDKQTTKSVKSTFLSNNKKISTLQSNNVCRWILRNYHRDLTRIWNKYPKTLWKFFTLMSYRIIMSYRKINIVSEKIINYRVTSPSNHYCQIRTWVEKDLEFRLYTISKTRTHSCQYLFYVKLCSLNRFKVLYVYVNVTVLIWQKVNKA